MAGESLIDSLISFNLMKKMIYPSQTGPSEFNF